MKIGIQHTATGATVYAIVRKPGSAYNATDDAFEDYATANLSDYANACSEEGAASCYYSFTPAMSGGTDWLSNIAEQFVEVLFFSQAGGSPAEGDTFIGSKEVSLARDGSEINRFVGGK